MSNSLSHPLPIKKLAACLLLSSALVGCSSTGSSVAWPWSKDDKSTPTYASNNVGSQYDLLPTASTGPVNRAPISTSGTGNFVTVKEGDTLYGIARSQGITTASLMQANGLVSPDQLKVGSHLIIPRFGSTAAPQQPTYPVQNVSQPQPTYTQPMPVAPQTSNVQPSYVGSEVVTGSITPAQPTQRFPSGNVYYMQPGDTLYSVSRRSGVPVANLISYNQIRDINAIKVGTPLRIPGNGQYASNTDNITTASIGTAPQSSGVSSQYRVVKGDTVYAIGRKTGIHPNAIMAKNQMSNPNQLRVGQMLIIPSKAEESALITRAGTVNLSNNTPSNRVNTQQTISQNTQSAPKNTVLSNNQQLPATSGFNWPVRGRIIAPFGAGSGSSFNNGIDISVPENTQVLSAADGQVAYVGKDLKGYGNLVLVRHADDWVSAYAHNSKILVKQGDRIRRGQPIALSGKSGNASSPRLHFELRKRTKAVDPIGHLPRA